MQISKGLLKSSLRLNKKLTNLLTKTFYVLSLKATLQLTFPLKENGKYVTRKLLKKEQFVLLYYHPLPVERVTIYKQVPLVSNGFPPKHSSSIVCDFEISTGLRLTCVIRILFVRQMLLINETK